MSNEVILKKITSLIMVVFLLSALPLFSKTKEILDDKNKLSEISVTSNAIVYNSDESENPKKVAKDENLDPTPKGVITIINDAEVFNIEGFTNAKIIKVEKAKRKSSVAKKRFVKNNTVAKPKIKVAKISIQSTYNNSKENSAAFSQNSTDKIAFSTSSRVEISKAIIYLSQISRNTYRSRGNQKTIYINPVILSCHFSGDHSIRPPTS